MGTVLVTGAGGFIGSRIATHLLGRGWDVRGMIRTSPSGTELQFPKVYGDLVDEGSLEAVTRGTDTVIHCAALVHRPSATMDAQLRVNVEGTRSLIRQAIRNGVKQFIFMSTISVYGKGTMPHREEDALLPITPYGQAKAKAEDVCMEEAAKAGLPLVIIRLSTVYGEGEPGNVNRLIRAVDRFGPIVIGDGKNQKSMTYVANVAELCEHILTRYPQVTTTANVADPQPYTLREIVETIQKALGRNRNTRFVGKLPCVIGSRFLCSALRVIGKTSPITPRHIETIAETSVCDTTRLQETLAFWAPIRLEQGISLTTRWHNNRV